MNLLNLMTRQQAAFFSLINNFQEASGAMDAMANSAGVLEEAYDTYLDSTTAHINQFKAAWQELGADMFNSKFISNIVDIGTAFTGWIDALVQLKLLIPTIITGVLVKRLITMATTTANQTIEAQRLALALANQKAVTDDLNLSLSAMNQRQLAVIKSTIIRASQTGNLTLAERTQILTELQQINANNSVIASNTSLAASFRAVTASIPGWGILLMSLTAVTALMGSVAQAAEEMKQKFAEDSQAVNSDIEALEEYKQKVLDISESEATQAEKLKDLNEIRESLNNAFDANIQKTEDETKAITELNKEIDKEIEKRRDLYLIENEEAYKKAVKQSTDFQSEKFHLGGYHNYKNPLGLNGRIGGNVSESIASLFSTDELGRVSLGQNAKTEIELLNEYENVLLKIQKIREDRKNFGQDLNKQELAIYNNVKKYYEELKNDIGEEGYNYSETMAPYAQKQAESLIAKIEQGTKSIEEWREELISMADGDVYVIEALNNIINDIVQSTTDLPGVVVDVLDEINKTIESINNQLDDLNTNMMAAKDYFEDLAKTIKDNDDADKFFTSTEIIDLLDKYPELSNAILETTYGYKIEAEALENLRQTKLAEQKDALASQIVETESAIESVQQRLDAYAAEIQGVKTLEEAKTELAMVEAQLAKLNGATGISSTLLDAWTTSIEKRRKALSGWIETSNELEKLSQSLKKSKMQYTVLGNVFDDIKDKSNDTTTALNNQKSALKDLSDEYKDAQDAIEDLVKLTMDMLKKNANLRKEDLKSQLDAFKKLIDKRKELIDLEKDCTKCIVRYITKGYSVSL